MSLIILSIALVPLFILFWSFLWMASLHCSRTLKVPEDIESMIIQLKRQLKDLRVVLHDSLPLLIRGTR